MEITCECGHLIEAHKKRGCKAVSYRDEEDWSCGCTLSKDAVEARYWARVMRVRYLARVMWCKELEKERDEYKEHLRMCQLTLRTMDEAQTELASYTKIAVDALKKIAQARGGVIVTDEFGRKMEFNNYEGDIAIEALNKIKGKF